jgi:Cof subfamily protein (haloacid dehalogenase superfamily)
LPLSADKLKYKLKDVKLVVSDIDGTLVTSDFRVSENLPVLISKLRDKGVFFSIASQRVHSSICSLAEKLKILIPVISLNGSLIQDVSGSIILSKSILNPNIVDKAINLAEKNFVKISHSYNEKIIYTEDNSIFRDFFPIPDAEYLCIKNYDDYKDGILRIYLAGNEKNNILKIKKQIKPFYNFSLKVDYFRSQSQRHLYKLEIHPAGITKRKALGILAKHMKLKKNEIAVIGDWYNDVELFEFGAVNVTLKNGIMDLKRKADYVSPYTNDEGGVEDFLNILLNSKD